jgi:hypothetical protein
MIIPVYVDTAYTGQRIVVSPHELPDKPLEIIRTEGGVLWGVGVPPAHPIPARFLAPLGHFFLAAAYRLGQPIDGGWTP